MKLLRALLLSSLCTLPFAAHAEEAEYVFLLKGRGNIFWKVIREGIEETARAKQIKAVILNTDDDQTPEAQLNMCQASLSRKPKIIVMGAATKNVGIECFRKAAGEGVLAADIDGNVSVEDAKQAMIPLAFSVGSDNILIGATAAKHLASIATSKNPKVLVLKGLPGSIVSENRANGFINELKKLLPEAQIIGTPTVDWDRLKAMNTALDYLQRESELQYIFSVSDVMTLGVVEGLRVANKEEKIQVLSVDGIADGRKAITAGHLRASVAQLPLFMGKRAVELAIDAVEKHISGVTEYTPTPLLTKDVLEKNEDKNLRYLR
jgi:ribose transport system substrate-binding protein